MIMLQKKDAEIQQLSQMVEDRKRDLVQKQMALDSLQHRPVPKPRTAVTDPQMVKELAETKAQLIEMQKEVMNERRFRETAEQRARELRTKIELLEMEASKAPSVTELNMKIDKLRDENDSLKDEVYRMNSKGQYAHEEISRLKREIEQLKYAGERVSFDCSPKVCVVNDLCTFVSVKLVLLNFQSLSQPRDTDDDVRTGSGGGRHAKVKRLVQVSDYIISVSFAYYMWYSSLAPGHTSS